MEELESLGCSRSSSSCTSAPSWVYGTSYWSGTAHVDNYVWLVNRFGEFNHDSYGDDDQVGVRPVIKVLESDFVVG